MSAMVSDDVVIGHVLVVIAMAAEAEPLLKKLNLTVAQCNYPDAPCLLYSGAYQGCTVSVVTNGKCNTHGVDNVGTVPAALSTFLAISQLKPDLIINAGTAGGFQKKGAAIGDRYICTHMKNHDRRIPIPGFTEYGTGGHTAHPSPNIIEVLGLKIGIVTTGNSLDHTEMDDKLMLDNDASVKDMEAAAIAWAANLSSTPFIALKVVTGTSVPEIIRNIVNFVFELFIYGRYITIKRYLLHIVDGDRITQDEFFENLGAAAASLQEILPRLIEFVVGKKLNML